MSDIRGRGDPVDGGAPGVSAVDLHDAIARHLDGGLEPDAQRALARQLAASPEARRLLAGHLRIEAALLRLGLAGQLSPAAGEAVDEKEPVAVIVSPAPTQPVSGTGRGRGGRWIATGLAIAGVVLVALVLVRGRGHGPGGGEMDLVAAQWLRVARQPGSFAADEMAVVLDDGGDDAGYDPSDEPDRGPPSWLVVAMADEEFQRLSPDAG